MQAVTKKAKRSREELDAPLTEEQKALAATCVKLAFKEAYNFAAKLGMLWMLDDFQSQAMKALMDAARDHRPERAKFTTYAVHMIRWQWDGWLQKHKKRLDRYASPVMETKDGDEECIVDFTPDNELPALQKIGEDEEGSMIRAAIAKLSWRDREVLRRVVVDGEPMRILAAELGVTRSRVDQLRDRAIDRLKKVYFERLDAQQRAYLSEAA